MKRKPNPIRGTVENWISRRPKDKKPKPKITLKAFFEDLENKGPFNPNSLFRQWTSSIHNDMLEAGTWIKRSKPSLKATLVFVQEYISRLQVKFWRMNDAHECEYQHVISHRDHIPFPYWYNDLNQLGFDTFVMIYKMIRVFGLRMKFFCLQKPRVYRGMKYEYFLDQSVVAGYSFGKDHIEKVWSYFWARRTKSFKAKMFYCAPLKMRTDIV